MSMAPSNVPELSVTELSLSLKRTVEDAYGWVRVRGELGELKVAASGHAYFRLKDDKSVLDCVCWRIAQKRLGFRPEDGLEVICSGRITTYPGRSTYQLVVEQMEPAGVGALLALLEDRRRKLAAEGLFDPERKRPLPHLPEVIGVVTSPTGAVIQDILHRIAERFPRRVLVWPVMVQGEGAAEQIAAAINGFSALAVGGPVPRPDLVIVARGGGSLQDLWAFNEEVVVRAAAASTIPLISAVGHETDTTLIDFASDLRAPTPTAAAELAVPVRRELLLALRSLDERLLGGLTRELRSLHERLDGLRRGLPEPRRLLAQASQRLDDLAERLRLRSPALLMREMAERLAQRDLRLRELLKDSLRRARRDLATTGARLLPEPVRLQVQRGGRDLARLGAAGDGAIGKLVRDHRLRLEQATAMLRSLGHEAVLERGYAIVRRSADGQLLTRYQAAQLESELSIQFADGILPVLRGGGSAPRRRRGGKPEPAQDTLL